MFISQKAEHQSPTCLVKTGEKQKMCFFAWGVNIQMRDIGGDLGEGKKWLVPCPHFFMYLKLHND